MSHKTFLLVQTDNVYYMKHLRRLGSAQRGSSCPCCPCAARTCSRCSRGHSIWHGNSLKFHNLQHLHSTLSRTMAKLNWEDFVHICTQLYTNLYGIDFFDIGRDNGDESGGNLSGENLLVGYYSAPIIKHNSDV